MVEERELHVGENIIFTDAQCQDHNALVTVVWDPGTHGNPGCCNLVFVSGDESKTDPYGRQIERHTSVTHVRWSGAPGFCWRYPEEEKPIYREPTEK